MLPVHDPDAPPPGDEPSPGVPPAGNVLVLVAMAGLPGTGKSTLARALAHDLGAPVLDKDRVRVELFGRDRIEYSRAQDDACMRSLYASAVLLARCARDGRTRQERPDPHDAGPARVIAILDGRTYGRHESVDALLAAAREAGVVLLVLECRCADELAERRLAQDRASGSHPARNRDPALHRSLKACAEPLEPVLTAAARQQPAVRHVVLNTDDSGAAAHAERIDAVRAALALIATSAGAGPAGGPSARR